MPFKSDDLIGSVEVIRKKREPDFGIAALATSQGKGPPAMYKACLDFIFDWMCTSLAQETKGSNLGIRAIKSKEAQFRAEGMTGKSAAKAAAASVSGVKQKKKAKKQRCAEPCLPCKLPNRIFLPRPPYERVKPT